jgi:glycerophosphoryl diester phosphodiesterase
VLMRCWFCRDLMSQMDAFRMALDARVDCVEVDVSRSSDGVLFALHDR